MRRTTYGLLVGLMGAAVGAWWWRRRTAGAATEFPEGGAVIFRNTPLAPRNGVL